MILGVRRVPDHALGKPRASGDDPAAAYLERAIEE